MFRGTRFEGGFFVGLGCAVASIAQEPRFARHRGTRRNVMVCIYGRQENFEVRRSVEVQMNF